MTFKALITEKTDDGYQSRVGDKNLEDLPEGDVLVRVAWSSLNYKDALSASGNKGVTRSFPHTPGIDAAGVVEEAGKTIRDMVRVLKCQLEAKILRLTQARTANLKLKF